MPGLAGRRYLVPQAAVQVEPVAVGLSRSAVTDVGVQRMPVVSGLDRPVRAGEHGERAGDAGPGRRWSFHRRPVGRRSRSAARFRLAVGRAEPGPAAPGPGHCILVRPAALAQYPFPPPDDAFPDWLLVTGFPDPFRTYHVPPKLVSAWPLATPGPGRPEKA